MPVITVTFVRHGESTDNLRSVWAGWADAPLSNHGMNQAKAAGEYFSSTHFDHIYASPLKRAYSTGQAILSAQPSPKPQFTVSPDVREQYFGVAEGKPWSMRADPDLTHEEMFARGIYPVLSGRSERFPEGESLNDLQARAERAIEDIATPYVKEIAEKGWDGRTRQIAVVSHGLCISELIPGLLRKDGDWRGRAGKGWTGLYNTAWTRVAVDIIGVEQGKTYEDVSSIPLKVRVTHVNQHSHLDKVKRQQGGVGKAAYDPKQSDIRAFFGGKISSDKTGESTATEAEEGRALSNAKDEVGAEMDE